MTNPFMFSPHDSSLPTEKSREAFYFAEFNAKFPTEDDCLEELYKRADAEAVQKCRHCGNFLLNKRYGERVSTCQNCSKQTWHTAGTFFEGIRLARAWLAAIWLMEHGIALSSSMLHKLLGIAQSTALNILHKIRTVVRKYMEHHAQTVSSAIFSNVFRKRSFVTPAYCHPRAEQEEINKARLNESSSFGTDADTPASLAADLGARFFGRHDAKRKEAPSARHAEDLGLDLSKSLPRPLSGWPFLSYGASLARSFTGDRLCYPFRIFPRA